ncbi:MAG: hypothetical protein JNL09_08940, partial [Anaerolineales bacterium]|nr:hypothetical protein [Anaerolineales bacterium]
MLRNVWNRCLGLGVLMSVLLAACAPAATPAPAPTEAMMMDMSGMSEAPTVPAGLAYAEGQEIRFIHTEVSDAEIGKLLTDMMSSPVLVVPSLAQVPESALAKVYVFSNGLKGMGPLGFQPDVFDNPPGTEGYTPLRALYVVTWKDEATARELKAEAEVLAAETAGEVTIERQPVVINMPFVQ